jgi:hypothetical protein
LRDKERRREEKQKVVQGVEITEGDGKWLLVSG